MAAGAATVHDTLHGETTYRYRKFKSDAMMAITVGATVLTLIPLFLVLGYLLTKGVASLNWAFFTHMPAPVGEKGGGMANAIVGTLEVVGIACLIGVPIGVGAGLYLAANRASQFTNWVRFSADVHDGRAVDRGRNFCLRGHRAAVRRDSRRWPVRSRWRRS